MRPPFHILPLAAVALALTGCAIPQLVAHGVKRAQATAGAPRESAEPPSPIAHAQPVVVSERLAPPPARGR